MAKPCDSSSEICKIFSQCASGVLSDLYASNVHSNIMNNYARTIPHIIVHGESYN